MPRISAFYGIIIWMYVRDHAPAHFHAEYPGQIAVFTIDPIEVYTGSLPTRAERLVREWGNMHSDELRLNWLRATEGLPVVKIEPLP